jgi:hypothetical protein
VIGFPLVFDGIPLVLDGFHLCYHPGLHPGQQALHHLLHLALIHLPIDSNNRIALLTPVFSRVLRRI